MNAIKMLLGAIVVLMALGGMALAQDSGTTVVSSVLSPTITLDVPAEISFPLAVGDNLKTVDDVMVTSNTAWKVQASTAFDIPELSNNYYGHFWSAIAYTAGLGASVDGHGPGFLDNPLNINDIALSNTPTIIATVSTLGSAITVPVTLSQNVKITDPAENDYRIALVFTASAN